MRIKVSQRTISAFIIILVVFIFLSGFGWVNSEASYKYEVQDTVFAGKPLDNHQKKLSIILIQARLN